MMKINILEIIQEKLLGKTLMDLEYDLTKVNEGDDYDPYDGRTAVVPQKIIDVWSEVRDGEDACIYMRLENGDEVYTHLNEDIIVDKLK